MKKIFIILILLFCYSFAQRTITLTEFGDHQVIQRRIDGDGIPSFTATTADVTFSGLTANGTPDSIQVKIIDFTSETDHLDWILCDATPTGNVWSGTVADIPYTTKGEWFKTIVRSWDDGGIIAVDTGEYKWGIGDNYLYVGQSNAKGYGDLRGNANDTANDLAGLWENQDWIHLCDAARPGSQHASSMIILADSLIAEYGLPVGMIMLAVGSTGLCDDNAPTETSPFLADGSTNWGVRNANNPDSIITELYGYTLNVITNQLGISVNGIVCILWYQGENDTQWPAITTEIYQARMDSLHDWLENDIGYQVPFIYSEIGRSTSDAAGRAKIHKAQSQFHDPVNRRILANTSYYLTYQDDLVHLDSEGQDTLGAHFFRAIKKYRRGDTDGYRGPRITGWTRTGAFTAQATVVYDSGSSLAGGFTGIQIYDTTSAQQTVKSISSSGLVETVNYLPQGATISYAYGYNPFLGGDSTLYTKDNLGLAMEPQYEFDTITGDPGIIYGGIDYRNTIFGVYPMFWGKGNGPDSLKSGHFPTYPNGAFQPCTLYNMTADSVGYFNDDVNGSFIDFAYTNSSRIRTGFHPTLTDTTTHVYVVSVKYDPDSMFVCSIYRASYLYVRMYVNLLGNGSIDLTYRDAANTEYVRTVTGLLPDEETLVTVFFIQDQDSLYLAVYGDGAVEGIVPAGSLAHQDNLTYGYAYEAGYPFQLGYDGGTNYCSGKLYLFEVLNSVPDTAEMHTRHNRITSVGRSLVGTNSVDTLYLSGPEPSRSTIRSFWNRLGVKFRIFWNM